LINEILKLEIYEFGAQCKDLHVNMNGMGCWRKMKQKSKKSCACKTKLGCIKSLSSKRLTHEEQSIDSLFSNTSVSHSTCVDERKNLHMGFSSSKNLNIYWIKSQSMKLDNTLFQMYENVHNPFVLMSWRVVSWHTML